jgi:hypothetical protein
MKSQIQVPGQDQTQVEGLREILKKRSLTPEDVDIVLRSGIPKVPIIHVTREIYSNIAPLTTIAVGGPGGAVGALFALSYANPLKYVITTKDVLSGKIPVSKKVLDYITANYNIQVINLDALDYKQLINTFLVLLRTGGIYVSGLPTLYLILLSQLAGFGKLWHFDNEKELFYVF